MGTMLRLYDGAGAMLDVLPDFTDLDANDLLNDVAAFSFTYPRQGANAALLDTEADRTIGVVLDGVERMRFLLEDDGRDEADGTAPLTITGRSTLALLERALVWPTVVGSGPATRVHTAATPGTIVRTHGLEAQARGVFPTVTFASFSNTLDSAGQAWTYNLSISYDVGRVNLLALVLDLAERGVVDARMVGTDLRLYNPGTTLAPELAGVVLRRGRDLKSAPRNRTRREIATTTLAVGENGTTASVTDAAATATFGRREGYVPAAGVGSAGTLAVLAGLDLSARKQPKRGHTSTLNLDPDGPVPWADFDLGGWIRQDALDGTVERVRVRGIGVKRTSAEARTAELVLNDAFVEAEVRIARQVAGITGGGDATVGTVNTGAPDKLAPAAPGAAVITTAVYQAADGQWFAQATVDWPDVVTNSDGSAIDDLDGYLVSYQLPQSPNPAYTAEQFTSTSVAYLDGLPPGKQVQVKVRARDRSGNLSATTTSAVTALASDTTAPQQPSAPVPTATIGGGRLTWDGLGANALPMPPDFDRAVLYVSTVTGFAPSTATARGDFVSAASVTVGGLPYVVHYAKLVAYDRAGNASAPSAEVSFTPRKVIGTAGGTTDFAALTIGDADVGNMSVTRLTAGTLLSDMVLGARIKTADTGARVELNSTGVKVYSSGGALVVDLNSTGTATFSGTLVASNYYSRDTHPRIEIGPATQFAGDDVIAFTRANGTRCAQIRRLLFGGTEDALLLYLLDANGNDTLGHVWFGGLGGNGTTRLEQPGGVEVTAGPLVTYDGLEVNTGGIYGPVRGGFSSTKISEWYRGRLAFAVAAEATKDVSVSYPIAFSSNPIVQGTHTGSGGLLGHFGIFVFNASVSGASFRARDIDGTARTGSASIDVWACI